MSRFNLSEWALGHRSLVLYLLIVTALAGAFGYDHLGQSEDPPFTFKLMVVRTLWPGADAQQVQAQVTDRLMRKLQEAPHVDLLQAYSRPGESMIFFNIEDSAHGRTVKDTWYQVRKRIGDMRHELPAGVAGPFFNDEFGDVYTNLYALQGDGFSPAELRDYADKIRDELLRVPQVAKVDFFGDQPQRIYVEISNRRLAGLGLSPQQLVEVLRQQNAIAPSGVVQTPGERIAVRTDGPFRDVAGIRNITFRLKGHLFRLGDIARVYRGYEDPPTESMRFEGKQVLGIGVTMRDGGDVIVLGKRLEAAVTRIQNALPVGLQLRAVTSMPKAVKRSVDEFLKAVAEAVMIVLLVSLLTLGLRTGAVVVITIPLVLAATAFFMWLFNIGLHKVSLGSLILALGLLVDDAIIAVEMMAVKLEQGYDRLRAASFAYTSTAFPMLTGTLVTVAGFVPIAIAKSSTGEYTRSIFEVSAISLLSSWVAAVVVVPYLGYKILPEGGTHSGSGLLGWLRRIPVLARRLPAPPPIPAPDAIYATPFYRRFRRLVTLCVRRRKTVLAVTALVFAAAVVGLGLVPKQFFPDSSRPELLVDLQLPEGSAYAATLAEVKRLEAFLKHQSGTVNYVSFVGTGAPRFFLSLDQKLPQSNYAQFIVTTSGTPAREALRQRISAELENRFPLVRGRVIRLENGPPVGYPVQFRVSGDDIPTVRRIAHQVAAIMRADPRTVDVHFNWDQPSKVVRLAVDQEKARLLGISSADIAGFLQMSLSGYTVTKYRERDKLIGVQLRAPAGERADLNHLADLAIPTATGKSVPLSQVAKLHFGLEDGIIWEEDRHPTITVRSDIVDGAQALDVTRAIDPKLDAIRTHLPLGYRIEVGGAVEKNLKAQDSINAGMPIMLFTVVTLLMLQLQSFRRTFMVVLTAPLGMIGVTAALLLFGKPFGFVAMLGTIAMVGIIMRNSVILVDQIQQDIRDGAPARDAIVEATVRRFRPITLTAAAAVLALIPLVGSDFFGPMAVALMGGITVATVLTLLFLPALYAMWMRIAGPAKAKGGALATDSIPPSADPT